MAEANAQGQRISNKMAYHGVGRCYNVFAATLCRLFPFKKEQERAARLSAGDAQKLCDLCSMCSIATRIRFAFDFTGGAVGTRPPIPKAVRVFSGSVASAVAASPSVGPAPLMGAPTVSTDLLRTLRVKAGRRLFSMAQPELMKGGWALAFPPCPIRRKSWMAPSEMI